MPVTNQSPDTEDYIFANGVEADSGHLLPLPNEGQVIAAAKNPEAIREDSAAKQRVRGDADEEHFGTIFEVDPNELDQAGWGILFAADIDAAPLKEALAPLLQLRRDQAGDLFQIFEGEQGVRADESAEDWLKRQGEGPGLAVVDPSRGVPYYLLIVGPPEKIPMSFQYMLDIFWAVGRLYFDDQNDYARYAEAIVTYEKAAQPTQLVRRAALFATEHPFDQATAMFTRDVAEPFADATAKPLGKKQKFALLPRLGDAATKDGFLDLLRGGGQGAPPLLFSGTHGMSFQKDNPLLTNTQGALVCQDWEGFGSITEDDWFAAADLPKHLNLQGMIHFLFACYGGGWESVDTFRDGPGGKARQIAERAGIAKLPQAMLSRGAMAVIAHVDRAWSYSFRTTKGMPQSASMRNVLVGLMKGLKVGHAVDQFNVQWAALTVPIADQLRDSNAQPANGKELMRLWIARDDARNYTVLGDPAVHLRVSEMNPGI